MFEKDKDLSSLTTFHVPARARLFAQYSSAAELLRISRTDEYMDNEVFHVGGGSNLLFVGDYDGLVLHSAVKGIKAYRKDDDTVFVIAGAAEKWSDLVDWCVDRGYAGMECMAGIPGEVGASPVQNVGAYGSEAADVIHNVECFDSMTRETVTIPGSECGFAYRDSRFKHEWKNRYYVLRVSFRLRPSTESHCLTHGGLRGLAERLGHTPTLRETRDEVVRLRASKLPDPAVTGSAGSFFKNPVMSRYYFREEVLPNDPDVPCYNVDEHRVKVPAGWLIEHAGLKGFTVGGAEVYPGNCLVIANKGNATAEDVEKLSQIVIREVMARYAVNLQPEVNFIKSAIDVTVLGSGTSKGIPEATCECHVCRSEDPHDKRLRASVLVNTMGMNILIDASPDFRRQMLDLRLKHIDALLITHSHYDHVGGIDDLRPFCTDGAMPIYVRRDVDGDLRRRLDYCFRETLYPGVPSFDMHIIENRPFYINGIDVMPIEVHHGKLPIFGFRIGKFAYVTDCKSISEDEKEKLYELDTLIINGLRVEPHFSHLSIPEAVELIKEVRPKRAYLTHFCHKAGTHAEIEAMLPENVHAAYDGLRIHIE